MKTKMYIESDNGGRAVAINHENKWYFVYCAPFGTWGDIDILNGTEEEAAARIRAGIDSGECYDEADAAAEIEAENDLFRHVPEYDGMTVAEIENHENSCKTCDFTRFFEI